MGSLEKLEKRVAYGAKEWKQYVESRLKNGLLVEEGFNLAMLEIEVPFLRLGFDSFADFLKSEIPHIETLLKDTHLNGERSVIRIESTDTLKCGTRVVWFGTDSTPYKGTIRWLGRVEKILCAGILCDKKIGHPFPLMWKENCLFYFPTGQGILIRVNELILKSDYDQKSTSKMQQALRRLMRKVNIRERPRNSEDSYSENGVSEFQQYDVIYPYAVQFGPKDLSIGHIVNWTDKNVCYAGTIKWLGHLHCKSGLIAGVDFAQIIKGNSSGIYGGHKLFECNTKCGRFLPIGWIRKNEAQCLNLKTLADLIYERPRNYNTSSLDSKDPPSPSSSSSMSISVSSNHSTSSLSSSSASAIDSLSGLARRNGTENFVTPERLKFLIGYKKGIQSRNNSCHLDSALFALFSVTDAFDSTLLQSHESDSLPFKILKEILRTKVVNKLRRNFYCSASNVQIVEQILDVSNMGKGKSGDILSSIFENANGFLKFTNGTSAHVHRILASSSNLSQKITTVQNLLAMDFKLQNLQLKIPPSPALIIVFPEQDHEVVPVSKFFIPNSVLKLTDLVKLENSSPNSSPCVLCGEISENNISCPDCVNEESFGNFCITCYLAFHSHIDRRSHKMKSKEIIYELQSIICTRDNQSIVFCKSGTGKDGEWIAHENSSTPQVQHVVNLGSCFEALEQSPDTIMKEWDSLIPEIKIILSFSHLCIYIPVKNN